MLLTGTVHPPGGASAVLAATTPEITAMGWYFVGLVMWGTTLMLIVGLIINNIQRQFPVYWWTLADLRKTTKVDVEAVGGVRAFEETDSDETTIEEDEKSREINISAHTVSLPDDLALSAEEARLLEKLRHRLGKRWPVVTAGALSVRSSAEGTIVPSQGTRRDSDASAMYA